MRNSDVQRIIENLEETLMKQKVENALAGEKVVCDDDHEYSIGTREAYEEFVKKRNYEAYEEFLKKRNYEIPVSTSTSEKNGPKK